VRDDDIGEADEIERPGQRPEEETTSKRQQRQDREQSGRPVAQSP
jgi:hypothetical protein